jgi:AcrR family transcriptional regulator
MDTLHDMTQPPRRRDAAGTRQALLAAARHRFATNGYAATTVRDIADEAGVNVALISRYFTSKEGLFEACLTGAVDEIGHSVAPDVSLDDLPRTMVEKMLDDPVGKHRLLLLLRTAGDPAADQVRRTVLRTIAERLVTAAGLQAPDAVLRAEMVMATALGMVLMRSTIAVEPMASVDQEDLVAPLGDVITALLRPSPRAS